MKALTLQQPWATLIALGHKKVETRKWHPKENPGKLVICSSKKPITGPAHERMRACEPFASCLEGHETPASVMLAVVTVKEFRRTEELSDSLIHELPEQEYAFGDYSRGRWAWFLTEVVALPEPVPLVPLKKGQREFRLGVWELGRADENNLARAFAAVG